MRQTRLLVVFGFLLLCAAALRAQFPATPGAPSPQHCQITAEKYNGANVQVFSCFAQPDPFTGKWESDIRLLGTANAKGEYHSGYAMLVESTRDPKTGEELNNRWGLWDFKSQKTIALYGDDNPGIFGIPESLWLSEHLYAVGFVQAGGGYYSSDWRKGVSGRGTCVGWSDGLCVELAR